MVADLEFKLLFSFCIQDLLQKTNATDASGNIVLGDIGVHIQQEVGFLNQLHCSMTSCLSAIQYTWEIYLFESLEALYKYYIFLIKRCYD